MTVNGMTEAEFQRACRDEGYPRLASAMTHYMLEKLREKSHKSHWMHETTGDLFKALLAECGELFAAITGREGAAAIAREAADVANIAAMLADNAGAYAGWKKPEDDDSGATVEELRIRLQEVKADRDRWVTRMKLLERRHAGSEKLLSGHGDALLDRLEGK